MNIEALEAEARQTAIKHVSNMLQRPDQLEKVEQYKKRIIRKKVKTINNCFKTLFNVFLMSDFSGRNAEDSDADTVGWRQDWSDSLTDISTRHSRH